jgi:hypothetical protein
MLAMSTSPASASASPSAVGSSAAAVMAGSTLLSTTGSYGSTTVVDRCVNCDTSSSTVGAGLQLLSASSPHRLSVAFVPLIYGVGRRNLLQALGIQWSAYTTLQDKYLTTLLEEFTPWDVVSVTFNFLVTRLRATLRGLLSGACRLASKLVGGSRMRGTLGSLGRLNLDHNWNRS